MSEKVAVVRTSTGERLERWPVDARAMVATGEWTFEDGSESPAPSVMALSSKGEPGPNVVMPQDTPRVIVKAEDAPPGKVQEIPRGRTAKRGR